MLLTFPLIDRLHFVIRRISQHIYLNRMNCDQSGRFRTCGYVVGSFSIQASLSPGTPQYRVTRTSYAAFTPGYMSPENMYPGRATCIRGYICRRINVDGYKLLVRDTCRLYLGDIITIYLYHGRLVSICIQQQTGDKLATCNFVAVQKKNMLTATSGYNLYPATWQSSLSTLSLHNSQVTWPNC